MCNRLAKAAIDVKCRFIILLSVLISFNALSNSNVQYKMSVSPYTQKLDFRETQGQKIFNQEEGFVNGANVLFSITSDVWRAEGTAEYAKGTLDYLGKSQLGRTVETSTLHKEYMLQLLVARSLYNFNSISCSHCGVIEGYLASKYIETKRIISSKGNISGLHETYTIPMIEAGVVWKLVDINGVGLKISASRAEAIDAKLRVDFQSNYDISKIPLNDVFVNEVELSAGYSFTDTFSASTFMSYSAGAIEQSDKFPLYLDQLRVGEFYQPERTRKSKMIGVRFNYNY